MRIIAGSLKGRKIPNVFDIKNVSPSSDFLKGVLFNVLGQDIEGKVFCDLYAGTGSVGFEAISRGAAFCIFIESSPELISIIINLSKRFGVEEKVKIIKKDVLRAIERGVLTEYKPDFIFIDPPYLKRNDRVRLEIEKPHDLEDSGGDNFSLGLCGKTIEKITENFSLSVSKNVADIIIQHDKLEKLSNKYQPFELAAEKMHGKSVLSFYHQY